MTTTITMSSKGQFTLPVAMRQALQLEAGDTMDISIDPLTRKVQLSKPMGIDELRAMNKKILAQNGASLDNYKSGDGFRWHVAQKYGKK